MRWPFKLIYEVKSRERMLFNLRSDPDEERNVTGTSAGELAELNELVTAHLEDVP